MQTSADLAIVGGGLVGLCAALALQRPERRICIIESSQLLHASSDGLNARSIALSYASVQIFKALGIWADLRKHATAIQTIQVSSRGHWGVSRLAAADYDLEAMGYLIESQQLGASLLARVQASDAISLITGAEFISAENNGALQLDYRVAKKQHSLMASLGLIADGAQSQARASLGIDHRTLDYQQAALLVNLRVSKPIAGAAFERFTRDGPLAMLPLGQDRYACVWTHDPAHSEALMAMDEKAFCEALQDSFGLRLGFIEQAGDRFAFPLVRTEAQALSKERCLLIGNAANALHPVAGQGFNLALRDIARLGEILQDKTLAVLDKEAILSIATDYESARKSEQAAVIRIGDGLVTLFSNDLPLLGAARAAALSMLDILPPLKAEIAFAGMGFAHGGNAMLRGRS